MVRKIAGHQSLQGVLDAITPQAQDAHVGDVEQTSPLAHGLVFLEETAVLHGQLPPCEGHHAATGAAGGLKQGRAQQLLRGGHGVAGGREQEVWPVSLAV